MERERDKKQIVCQKHSIRDRNTVEISFIEKYVTAEIQRERQRERQREIERYTEREREIIKNVHRRPT